MRDQRFHDYEVVITDDSPDDSVEQLVTGFDLPAPVRYERNPRRLGAPENWNHCIALAAGRLIKILHHDDWFSSPTSLGAYIDLLRDDPKANLGFSATLVSSPDGTPQRVHRPSFLHVAAVRWNPRWLFPWNILGSPSATIYRREASQMFDPRLRWVVDIEFYTRVLLERPGLAYTRDALICTTNGLATQVTADCLGNREVELFEWTYFFSRVFQNATPYPQQLKFMWDLLNTYDVNSLCELSASIGGLPIPESVTRLVRLRGLLQRFRGR